MILYGIPNCNTVKKAQDWLKHQKIEFEFHDFKKKGITADILKKWCEVYGWEKVLNRAGLTFKKLSAEEKAAINSQEKAIAYLLQNTSAIKRPVVTQNEQPILIGFDVEEYLHTLR